MGGLILIIAFTFASAKVDAILINGGHYFTDHKPRFIFRAVVVSLLALFNPLLIIAYSLIFFGIFNPLLNRFRSLGFWYLGSTAKTDVFFRKHPALYKITLILSLISGFYIWYLIKYV